jgi:hypothetical protein
MNSMKGQEKPNENKAEGHNGHEHTIDTSNTLVTS